MATVDITDINTALTKVRVFLSLLEQHYNQWRQRPSDGPPPSVLKSSETLVLEQLPLMTRIAARADADLASKMELDRGLYVWPFGSIKEASQQLAGLLNSLDDVERILGPRGPKLSAANLHPWIWNAAVDLWDHGHLREAVQAAATVLFDQHLPAKLGVPGPPSAKDRISQAFTTDPPQPGKPRLRLADYPDPSPNWTSQHDGAKFFGMSALRRDRAGNGCRPGLGTCTHLPCTMSRLARGRWPPQTCGRYSGGP